MKKEFIVSDMTCGHCVKTITDAIHEILPQAQVQADTTTHWLTIEADQLDAQAVLAKIQEAGYSPQLA